MVFSTRISIKWSDNKPSENTSTVVMTSHKKGLFVDLRPFSPLSLAPNPDFPIDWAMTGREEDAGPSRTIFHHLVDSKTIFKQIEARRKGLPAPETNDQDLGEFSDNGDGDRKEVGKMFNDKSGIIEPYIEVWRSLDSCNTTPYNFGFIREVEKEKRTLFEVPEYCGVLQIAASEDTEWEGMIIRLGNWIQGLVYNKRPGLQQPLSAVRAWLDPQKDWQIVFRYGKDAHVMPLNFEGLEGDRSTVDGVCWTCVERS
ncbi:hypothetical protein BABINDRAFT_161789 [Babjeviella inositovora NRRL Y-12698]|uniref:Protein HRI1 n=1 Tax=Babjeviella inositovora NRRL Y-12698 TaxID=984486 RepID=A0A1E3QNU8_9ASCO|nr:uncharacterized protein BABINDRAFT_161789 [Babjeviella inositovora NRRL Y-12698]ODQ79386.1 hypothetical protein BABINDRAFT_161789 [Babjeviella inositovora NRRL Y-12698]